MAYPYVPNEQNPPEPPGAGGGQNPQEWFPYEYGLQPYHTLPPVSPPHIRPLGVPLLPWFFPTDDGPHGQGHLSMAQWDDQNPLNPPVDRYGASQSEWSSDWPPRGEGSGSTTQKRKRKRKRSAGSDSPESHRPTGVAGSHSSKLAQTNRFSYCLSATDPRPTRARKGSTASLLQQSPRPPPSSGSSAGVAGPPVNYASSARGFQCWKPEYPQENKPWRAILLGAATTARPKDAPVQEPPPTNQSSPAAQLPEACPAQTLTWTERPQPHGRLRVPQFPPPHSVWVPGSEIRFDVENAGGRGVPFADLLAGRPGLADARRQAFAADINPGGVVMWITWPGYPAWKDRLTTTDGGRPITLAELGCKIAKAYGRFFVDRADMASRNHAWQLGLDGVTHENLALTTFKCVGWIFWQADVELIQS